MKIRGTRQAPKLNQATGTDSKAKGAKARGASNQPAAKKYPYPRMRHL